MRIKAYAKVNLALKVINKREDGYHNLVTIMDLVDIYDLLHISKCEKTIFTCSDKSLENNNNLIIKVINILKNEYPDAKELGVRIHLEKHIPYGAGLGGGSSDAAATLIALNYLWKLNLTFEQMVNLALKIGSDVPYFLLGNLGILSGIGENINHIDSKIKLYYLLILPDYSCSTKEVYEVNKIYGDDLKNIDKMIIAFHQDDAGSVIDNMFNDLTAAAISINNKDPKIKDIIEEVNKKIIDNGVKGKAIMSGSGSTVFAAFTNRKDLELVASILDDKNYRLIKTTSKKNA